MAGLGRGTDERTATKLRPFLLPVPGKRAAAGARTAACSTTFVFGNDFAALTPDAAPDQFNRAGLLVADSERGICRVVCFSPRHDLTLGQLDHGAIRRVVDTWTDQYLELSALDWVNFMC